MKAVLLIPVILFIILAACQLVRTDEVKPFIPGTYARHYRDDYTDSYDTVQIQQLTVDGSEGYTVIKRSRFQKIDNDGGATPGYEIKKWVASYDEKSQTLWLQKAGKSIYFDPVQRQLKLGIEPYKKL